MSRMPNDNRKASNVEPLIHGFLRQVGLSPGPFKTRPVYRHISRAIERAITNSILTPALRLPAERELSRALRVSRATIVAAYRDLESRGLVRGYVGRGTYVSAVPDASGAPFAWRGKLASTAMRASDSQIRDLVSAST